MANGANVVTFGPVVSHDWYFYLGFHGQLFLTNLMYQGLLDLHGHLYNPNSGDKLGHLPTINFLDFVKTVSEDLLEKNKDLPYDLHLGPDSPSLNQELNISFRRASHGEIELMEPSHMRRPLLA